MAPLKALEPDKASGIKMIVQFIHKQKIKWD